MFMYVWNPCFPAGAGAVRDALAPLWKVACAAAAAACGRTTLDAVRIPPFVAAVTPRTRRLVRAAQISAW
jgi:hypothetical protein